METIDRINNCKNDKELHYLTRRLIKEALKETKDSNKYKGLIGNDLSVNPTDYYLDKMDLNAVRTIKSVDIWNGYIPINTKIVYGSIYNINNKGYSCGGYFYYLDDDKYVYDFIKYIKRFEIDDEFDVVVAVNDFVTNYFEKMINQKDRMVMHKLLLKDKNLFFDPIRKHSIKDFYHNGSAKCTEYAAVANNLFSVLKVPISYFCDKDHAYNIIYKEKEDNTYDSYVLDYSNCVFIFDINLNCIKKFPYFKQIEGGTQEFLNDVVNHGKRIKLDDYNILEINNTYFECKTGNTRDYGVDCDEVEEKKLSLITK